MLREGGSIRFQQTRREWSNEVRLAVRVRFLEWGSLFRPQNGALVI